MNLNAKVSNLFILIQDIIQVSCSFCVLLFSPYIKQLLGEVFVISGIIKVEVSVIS